MKLPVGLRQADRAEVGRRGGVQVPAEGQLDAARGDAGGTGDVGETDVLVAVGVDERDRPAQRAGVGVGASAGMGFHGLERRSSPAGVPTEPESRVRSGTGVELVRHQGLEPRTR